MIRSALYLSLVGVFVFALVGCSFFKKKKAEEEAAPPQAEAEMVPDIPEPDGGLAEPIEEGESTAAADAIIEQMKAGGLTADGFKKVGAKYGAKNCLEGTFDSIPTLMCEYADADTAKANQDQAVEFAQGMTTGVVERNGLTVIALKANKDLDKKNQKVDKIVRAFTKAK